eukprot:11157087-Lingulodinium_polyedra.AAC.1
MACRPLKVGERRAAPALGLKLDGSPVEPNLPEERRRLASVAGTVRATHAEPDTGQHADTTGETGHFDKLC